MSRKEEAIREIICYYGYNRQAGHTKAMLEGAKSVDCIVVMPNATLAQDFNKFQKVHAVSVDFLSGQHLRGRKEPLVLDHEVVRSLLAHQEEMITNLQGSIGVLQEEILNRENEINSLLQHQIDMSLKSLKMAEDARRIQRNR